MAQYRWRPRKAALANKCRYGQAYRSYRIVINNGCLRSRCQYGLVPSSHESWQVSQVERENPWQHPAAWEAKDGEGTAHCPVRTTKRNVPHGLCTASSAITSRELSTPRCGG